MNTQKKISFILMLIFLFATAVASNVNFYMLRKKVFDKEAALVIILIFLLYIFISYVVSVFIYKIIVKEKAVKESADNFKLDEIVSRIPGGMVSMIYADNSWVIDYVSLWCYENLGYREEIKKSSIYDMIYERDRVVLNDVLNNILFGSEYGEVDIRIRKADNKYIWVKVKINGIYNVKGELERVAAIIIDIDNVKSENAKLVFKAERDSLTGLLNKGTMLENIENYITKNKSEAAFIIIDVDNFKIFNDLLGHIYGDEALLVITKYLKRVFDENAYIGRLGGDEFCVFIPNIKSDEYVKEMVEKFLGMLRETKIGYEKRLRLLVSIGIAKYPIHGVSFRELYINSDKALYKTKDSGKNGYSVFK